MSFTKQEKINWVASVEKALEDGEKSEGYVKGFEDFNPDTYSDSFPRDLPYIPTDRRASHYVEGYFDAHRVFVWKNSIENDEVVTFDEVLSLPRFIRSCDYSCTISSLVEYEMLPRIIQNIMYNLPEDGKLPEISVEIIKDEYIDGERQWEMGVLVFQGKPVLGYNRAGRGGWEYSNPFIFEKELYIQMADYIIRRYEELNSGEDKLEEVDKTSDAEHWINFYNCRLEVGEEE